MIRPSDWKKTLIEFNHVTNLADRVTTQYDLLLRSYYRLSCLSVHLSVMLCIVALRVDIGGLNAVSSCSYDGISYSLLQTLLLYGVSFSHKTLERLKADRHKQLTSGIKNRLQFKTASKYSC